MKISEFMKLLYDRTDPVAEHYETTCDTLKAGDPETELGNKVAVAMFATPEVIRTAAERGAKLLIVHEPVFYDHWDSMETFREQTGLKREILEKKLALIQACGLTIFRYHDHPHKCMPDMISEGECKYFGLKGTWLQGKYYAVNRFVLDQPQPVQEVAATLKQSLNLNCVRIAGDASCMVKTIALCFGTPGHLEEELAECDIALTGEIIEWMHGEFIRDCAAFGLKKAIVVLGHTGSERDGMRLLAERISGQEFNGEKIEAEYLESGEVYSSVL